MPTTQTSDTLLDCTLTVSNENMVVDIDSTMNIQKKDPSIDLLDGSLTYKRLPYPNVGVDAILKVLEEPYDIELDMSLEVQKRNNVGMFLFDCSINVVNPHTPLIYQGFVTGFIDMPRDIHEKDLLDSTVNIDGIDIHKDFLCSFSTQLMKYENELNSFVHLMRPDDSSYDLLTATMEYFDREESIIDIDCSLIVPEQILVEFEGTTSIAEERTKYDLLDANAIVDNNSEYVDIVTGTVYVFPDPVNEVIIDGNFKYEKEKLDTGLDAFMYLETSLSRVEIPCQIKVKSRKFIYSLFSYMRVVPGFTRDIYCNITVFNDKIWDIQANLDIGYDRLDYDLLPQVDFDLIPYEVHDIEATVDIERVDTRREFVLCMFVVDPINIDIDCTMEVFTPYYNILQDIPCSLTVGNPEYMDILDISMIVEGALTVNNEIECRLEVLNELMPARVGIFVDPLWEYDPYVVKSSIVTFLDRITTKNTVKVIYGGHPRANWDIQHFCDVFGVQRHNQLEVRMNYCPADPIINQDGIHRFIEAMCQFTPEEYEEHPYIDKVFIFTNMPHTHRHTMLIPLLDFCYMYKIPLTCITSSGDFIDTTLPTMSGYNRTEYFDPLKHYMPWFYGCNGYFTKHRSIFNTDSITIPTKDKQ